MTKKNKVSVIIPAYNVAPVLSRVLESALQQTLAPKEVIVIDDGSDDDTIAVARTFGDHIILLQQSNQGQGAARNRGLQAATGEYVTFLDADDYWKPQFIEKMSCYLDQHLDVIAVSCGFYAKRSRKAYTGPSNIKQLEAQYPEGMRIDDFFAFWASFDHIRTGTVLMRKAIVDQAGYQNPQLRISQDLEYWGLLATWGPWAILPEVLWVGDSHNFAKKYGWRKKYAQRRRLCPSVEAWQARILPRLEATQRANFTVVTGRVAFGYALHALLGGNSAQALGIVQQYGQYMPKNKLVSAMRLGASLGRIGWFFTMGAIRLREALKS